MTLTLEDIYRKFGEAAEAGQLLETELENLLLKKPIEKILQKLLNEKNAHRPL